MEIKTKFNIRDLVSIIYEEITYGDEHTETDIKYRASEPITVKSICIMLFENHNMQIEYTCGNGDRVLEGELYTQQEAQAECDRRNGAK